ncbi:helix-turn-helix domain-containing protein [Cohnella fermenti]|uniref:Helix-turn-helix domain-containing protein n=1 Tax=Cohnella fermenti TaxID=2565925 RepID=A0A4V3WEM0_9BACL|nr:helix-turn-helix domain-containing protein [Cohnella fermenti]THF76889.1 helix-turn-helix domain-containing protein [Cohnella fermenti]
MMNSEHNRWIIKLITSLILFLFLIVTVSALIFYFTFTSDLKTRLVRTNEALMEHMNQKLELVFKNIDNEAIQLVQDDEVKNFFDDNLPEDRRATADYRIGERLDRLIRSDEYLFSVDLYSYSQDRLVSGDILTEESRQSNYDWIGRFAGFDGYSDWMGSRKLLLRNSSFPIYRNVVTFVRTYPLIHSAEDRRGAVAFNMKEELLLALIHSRDDDQGINLVLDKEGRVVLHPDQAKLGEDWSTVPFVKKLVSQAALQGQSSGTFGATAEGNPVMVFYQTSSYTSWTMVRIVSEFELNKPLTVVRNTLAVLSGVLLLLAAVLALALGRWTFRPLNRFLATITSRLNALSPQPGASAGGDRFQLLESRFEDILVNSERLQQQVRETKPILKWQLVIELLSDYKINIANTRQYMDMLGMPLDGNRFVVLVAEFDQRQDQDTLTPRDKHLYNYALCNVAEELILAEHNGVAIELENGCVAILMSFEDDDAEAELRAGALADLIKNYAAETLRRTITIGVGGLADSTEKLHLSFAQANEALSYRLVLGTNTVIAWEDVQGEESSRFYRLVAMTDAMMDSLKLLDVEKLKAQTDRWFEALAQSAVPPEMIRQLSLQCLMKASVVAGEAGIDPEQFRMPQEMRDMLNQSDSLTDMKEFLLSVLQDYAERIRSKRGHREKSDLIVKVLDYIRTNFGQAELSLNLLADEFRVSVSHLSKQFKEQTESNFIDYLMNLRIDTAKRMLTDTDGKIKDIAEAVGYSNVNSFVRIFKKLTALTPSEYREKQLKREDDES